MSEGIITSNGVPEKQPTSLESGVKDKMPPGKGRYTIGGKGTHGCKGYPVVGGEGKVHGCHTTRSAAMRQQAAIYASQNQQKLADTILNLAKAQEALESFSKEINLYDMLTPEEKAYHDALVEIVDEFGYFDQGASSVWVGYESGAENDVAAIGVKCGNCSFHYMKGDGSLGCKIVSLTIEEEGKCRLAAIPDGLVDENAYDMSEEDFVEDMMERMGKADGVSTGDMVSWGSSGGMARGKVVRVIRNGKYNVPSSDFTITGTPDDPAVAIRVYRDGKPTDTIVGHKMSTLRRVGKSMNKDLEQAMAILESLKKNIDNSNDKTEQKSMHQEDEDWAKRDYSPEQRRAMARRGQAMPDGSFPIGNRADLGNAIQSVGRAANYDAARRHIIGRARALGAIDMLPEDWNVSKSIDGLFKNMPSSAKRVHTTGNARISMKMFKDEQ